jgi:hypothetical protein
MNNREKTVESLSYDKAISDPAERKVLLNKWYNIKRYSHCEEWDNFGVFFRWAINSGYEKGAILMRLCRNSQFCPENCYWSTVEQQEDKKTKWIKLWNKTVNRIRKYYGMSTVEEMKGVQKDAR